MNSWTGYLSMSSCIQMHMDRRGGGERTDRSGSWNSYSDKAENSKSDSCQILCQYIHALSFVATKYHKRIDNLALDSLYVYS